MKVAVHCLFSVSKIYKRMSALKYVCAFQHAVGSYSSFMDGYQHMSSSVSMWYWHTCVTREVGMHFCTSKFGKEN